MIRTRAFSLIELVIVIVIIGAISAIAIPRLTRGATQSQAAALKANLAVMRNAIEQYRAEHEGRFPDDKSTVAGQLTMYTKTDGTDANPVPDVASGRIYGPYLRAIPSLPLGSRKGTTGFGDTPPGSADVGWFYDGTTGKIWAALDLDEQDVSGTPWSMY